VSPSYRAYGLEVHSLTPIELLQISPVPGESCDLQIEQGPEPEWVRDLLSLPAKILKSRQEPPEGAEPSLILKQHGEALGFELAYSDGIRFVTDGPATRLWATCQPPATPGVMQVCLVGPVMGFVLRRRGVTSLHSSCVEFRERAICFCGEAGFGKSTTAAALALRGLPVLAEDVVPLQESGGQFLAIPGYPRVCLWPESVQMLLGREDALPLITEGWEKRYLALDGRQASFAAERRQLGLVYVFAPRVDDASAPRIDAFEPREAALELIRNTYMNWLLDRRQRAEEFDTLCRLVERVPIRRIVPHAQPEKISELCDLILRDAEIHLDSIPNTSRSLHP